MVKHNNAATFAFLACVLTLCQPIFSQQEAAVTTADQTGKATVFFYRYKQFTGSALEPSVYCDDVQLARMDNGRYFVAALEPGQYTFRSNDKQSGVRVRVKPGETYFIRVELATGFFKGHGRLIVVPKEQGEFEVAKLKPLGGDKIKDPDRVRADAALH